MKFISLFLLLTIFLSVISSTRFHMKSRHRYRHRVRQAHNKYFQFAKACVLELAAIPDADVDKCLPPNWKTAKPSDAEDKEQKEASGSLKEQKSGWENVLGKLGDAINYVCKIKVVKKKIIDFFTKELSRRYNRYMKQFLEGKTKRLKKMSWSFDKLINDAKDAITAGAEEIKKGAIKVGKAVASAAGDVKDFVTKTLKETFNTLCGYFESIKAKVLAFYNSPLIQKLILFINCAKTLKKFAQNMVTIVTSWISLIGSLSTIAGWVKLVVKLICSWEDLAKAIGFLKEALSSGVKEDVKWQKYGQFVGKIIYTIGK